MVDWRSSVNQVVGSERIRDISKYIKYENSDKKSCVDTFYKETKSIMSTATPHLISTTEGLGAFLAVAIVSCTENYFRNVFYRVLRLCPQAQSLASSNSINLGSVIWHPTDLVERGAFEHISLASSDSIIQTVKKYVGLIIKQNSSVSSVLEEFDKVCELRHGIVHSGRVLAGKNAIRLQIPSSKQIPKIYINYANLQEISSVCTTLVVAFKTLLFTEMCERWATSWRRSAFWDPAKGTVIFRNIWDIFYSLVDAENGLISANLTYLQCKNRIKKEYNL